MQTTITTFAVMSAAILMINAGIAKRRLAWRPRNVNCKRRRP
jgi:hypothetical protein